MLQKLEFLQIFKMFGTWFYSVVENVLNSRWNRNKNFDLSRSPHNSEEPSVQEKFLSPGSESVKIFPVQKSVKDYVGKKSLRESSFLEDVSAGRAMAKISEREDSQEDLERRDRQERSRRAKPGQDAPVLSLPLQDRDDRIADVLTKFGTGTSLRGINYSTYVHYIRRLLNRHVNSDQSDRRRLAAALREKRFIAAISDDSGLRSLRRPDEVYLPLKNADAQAEEAGRRFRVDRDWLPLGDDPVRDSHLIQLLADYGVKALSDREWSEAA